MIFLGWCRQFVHAPQKKSCVHMHKSCTIWVKPIKAASWFWPWCISCGSLYLHVHVALLQFSISLCFISIILRVYYVVPYKKKKRKKENSRWVKLNLKNPTTCHVIIFKWMFWLFYDLAWQNYGWLIINNNLISY